MSKRKRVEVEVVYAAKRDWPQAILAAFAKLKGVTVEQYLAQEEQRDGA